MSMEQKMDLLLEGMSDLKTQVGGLSTRMDRLETRVRNVEVILDEEIRRDIQVLAEGHSILNRKLDEALKVEGEKTMFLVRFHRMESDVRELKQAVFG